MIRGLLVLTLGLLLSGCAALAPASGLLTPLQGTTVPLQVHEQTTVDLSQDDFVLVKTNVFGVSKGFSLLGLITIYPATLTKAMGRMYASAQMSTNAPQSMAHLIIEHSRSYWILFSLPRVEVHADVVQFRPTVTAREQKNPHAAPAKGSD